MCFFKPTADASHVLIWSFFCQLLRGRVWLTKFSGGAVFFFLKSQELTPAMSLFGQVFLSSVEGKSFGCQKSVVD